MTNKFSNFEIKDQMEGLGNDLKFPDWCKDSELENVDVSFLNYESLIDCLFLQDKQQQQQQQQQK